MFDRGWSPKLMSIFIPVELRSSFRKYQFIRLNCLRFGKLIYGWFGSRPGRNCLVLDEIGEGPELRAECCVAGRRSRAFQLDCLVGIAVESVIAGGQDGVCCFLLRWGAVLYIPR